MGRLVVVSNRVPAPRQRATAGGLAAALSAALRAKHGLWFGWSGKVTEDASGEVEIAEMPDFTLATVDLNRTDHTEYYAGYANGALWPLCHFRTNLVDYARNYSVGYQRVNRTFADGLVPLLKDDDLIWVHDYHLIPCGEELRRRGVQQRIGYFHHIPWPSAEIFVTLPQHRELVRALFAYDVIGFQTPQDLRTFLTYVVHEAGGTVEDGARVTLDGRTSQASVFPIGIDAEVMGRQASAAEARRHGARLINSLNGRKLIIGVDRLDYSKGIDRRFEAYRRLFELHPEHRAQVSFLQIASPSRGEVAEYQALRKRLERQAGEINGKFADYDWVPLRYVNQTYGHATLAGLYRTAAAALVTPLRDGMNLVAKEYVAAQNPADPGVLILSRFAGAATQLKEALIVNPYDEDSMVDALDRALAMSLDERKERWQALHRNVTLEGIDRWRDSFLAALEHTPRQPQRIQAGVRRTPGLIQAAAGHESLPGSGQRVG